VTADELARCQYCGHEIRFARDKGGRLLPFNPDGSRHYCDEYIEAAKRRKSRKSQVFDEVDFVEFDLARGQSPVGHQRHDALPDEGAMLSVPGGQQVLPVDVPRGSATTTSELESSPALIGRPSTRPGINVRGLNWLREEILLATDLYVRHQGTVLGPQHPDVLELSTVLRRLPLHGQDRRYEKFRNPNGVALKLSNIRAADPQARSKGSVHGSKLDGLFWSELHGDPEVLEREVAAIKRRYPDAFVRDTADIPLAPVPHPQPDVETATARQLKEDRGEPVLPVVPPRVSTSPKTAAERAPWMDAIDELRAQLWFEVLRKEDPRFDWFTRKFRGHVRPRVVLLHEWITAITSSPRLIDPDREDVREALLQFHDYVFYLHDLTLEDELFSIVSASTQAEHVAPILRDLAWDGAPHSDEEISLQTSMLLHAFQRGWFWTPALDRALNVLQREGMHDPRLVGPLLKKHGVSGSPSFSARALLMACQAFGRPMPAVVAAISE
jgi:hypothetical protein